MSIETYVKALKSPDPQKRRQAIVALGKSGDQRALKPLADTYKTDSDPQLRELALKAGRHLRKELTEDEPEPAPRQQSSGNGGFAFISDSSASSGSSYSAYDEPKEKPKAKSKDADEVPDWMRQMGGDGAPPKPVTDRDRARAASYIDRAMDARMRNDTKKMLGLLEKAIEINPGLERDGRTLGLLALAYNTSSEQALEMLRASRGTKKKGGAAGGGEWSEISDFFVEMGIWLLLIGLLFTGGVYLVITNIDWNEYKAEARAEGATEEEIKQYEEIEKQVEQQGPRIALYIGFGYGAALVVGATIISTFIWIVGTFMGGTGILFKFLTSTFRGIAVIVVVSTLVSFIGGYMAPGSDEAVLLGFAPLLFGMVYTGYAVGKVHEFGTAMGCLNLIVAVPACPFVLCILSFITAL